MKPPLWMKSITILEDLPTDKKEVDVVVFRRWGIALEMLRSVHKCWTVSPFWGWLILYWLAFRLTLGWYLVGEIRI